MWPFSKEPRAPEDLARDAVFGRASVAFTDSSFAVAGYRVAALVDRAPPPNMQSPTQIAWLGCGDERALGVYTPTGLARGTLERSLSHADLERDSAATLVEINALWARAECDDTKTAQAVLSKEFREVMHTGELTLWIRAPLVATRTRGPRQRHHS